MHRASMAIDLKKAQLEQQERQKKQQEEQANLESEDDREAVSSEGEGEDLVRELKIKILINLWSVDYK